MQTVLVCDDDKQIVEAIDIYLTGEGFEVVKAYDGFEALELLQTHDARPGRDPHHLKGAGDEQHPDHYPLGQVRGHG